MKTIEQILLEHEFNCLDGRDLNRLAVFLTVEQITDLGMEFRDGKEAEHQPIEFTRENILLQLKRDVEFGFEKALNKRGISSSLMYEVVSMWNWILEEGLEGFEDYENYGLPLFKATALKYSFENPIGDDKGNEEIYAG